MVSAEINGTRRIDCDPCPERIKWIIHDRRWVGILDSIVVLVVFIVLTACVTYLVRFYNTKWRTRTLSVQHDGGPARHPMADNFADRVLENYCKDYHRSPKVSNEVYALKTPIFRTIPTLAHCSTSTRMVDTRSTDPVPMDYVNDVYQSKTINPSSVARYNYLPAFPNIDISLVEGHLLANVPLARLSAREVEQRRHAGSTAYALQRLSEYSYRGEFSLSTSDTEALATKLHVHQSIVTYNAHRFRAQFFSVMDLRAWFRRQVIVDDERQAPVDEPRINSQQVAIILEFYLQMDVDVFYMKTCSFRGAQPHGPNQGLFCETDEPIARYGFLACQQPSCAGCHPSHVEPWPVVTFSAQSKHCFVNGYTTYLNCPATCTTSNVIYVMTCPCGEYDYVDSTNQTLSEAMAYHRERGNRVIHQYLTGSPLNPNATEHDEAILMRLYQHSAHCSVALRAFLDDNPMYWCFIPIPWDRSPTTDDPHPTDNPQSVRTIDRAQVMRCLRHVPAPPTAHFFSQRQRKMQHSFFDYFLSLDHEQQRPYRALDLFRVNIIVVLPEDRSTVLRYVIETMFVIHGETKLNMICPIGGDPKKRYGRPYQRRWYNDLCNRVDRDTATAVSTL